MIIRRRLRKPYRLAQLRPAAPLTDDRAAEAAFPGDEEQSTPRDPLRCPDHEAIRALSIELGRPAKTLIALSSEADPFYVIPAQIWVDLDWESVAENSPDGVHLRRLHYRLVSEPPASRPFKDVGRAYENTFLDWQDFAVASRDARHLELVDEALFTDRRAGLPVFVARDGRAGDGDAGAEIVIIGPKAAEAPIVHFGGVLYWSRQYDFPEMAPTIEVRAPSVSDPYALEIWVEKSAQNDVLDEDFDAMHAAIAPHQDILAEIEEEASEQVTTIESEAARSVAGIQSVADEAVREIEREAAERIAVIRRMAAGQIDPIQSDAAQRTDAIKSDADERSAEHVEAVNAVAREWYEQAAELQGRIEEAVTEQAPGDHNFEWASPEADENLDPLFDSRRDYLTQVDRYKAHQGKPTSRRQRKARRP
jgi:hypothetical protein